MSLLLAVAWQAVLAPRETLGVHGRWGAFRDAAPARCYAIAEPATRGGAAPFAAVSTWPGTGQRQQLHFRLSRPRAPSAKVTLSVGERRFELYAGQADAWAPDAATDRAIVGAMRSGRSMSVETVAANGRPYADVYTLAGAATAIDLASLRCARR